MKYKPSDICVCKHRYDDHDGEEEDKVCIECIFTQYDYDKDCQKFKLDNLKYIEEKAKEQGLI